MEVQALKGAEALILRCRPKLWIEVDRDKQRPLIEELLASWDYEWQEYLTPLFNPKNFRREALNVFGMIKSWNILASPRSAV